jgi:hypothetical protein
MLWHWTLRWIPAGCCAGLPSSCSPSGSHHQWSRRDPLFRRSVCAAGQPACIQVSRRFGLSVNDRKLPALTGRSGTQRTRPLRPELAAPLGVCRHPR